MRYDAETGFYYLRSRYYDSTTQRFLNADSVISVNGSSVNGTNLFSYCFNNPINFSDDTGNWPTWNDIKNSVNKIVSETKKIITKVSQNFGKASKKFASAFTLELGVGFGLKGSVNIGDLAVDAGIKADSITGIINPQESKVGQRVEAALSAGVGPFEFGPVISDWNPIQKNDIYESDFSMYEMDTVLDYGLELYFFVGGTVNLSIDLKLIEESVMILFE